MMRALIAAMILLAAANGEAKHRHHKHKHGIACGAAGAAACPENDYCKVESGCPGDANRGKCIEAPEMCAQDWRSPEAAD